MDDLESRVLADVVAEQWPLVAQPGPPPAEFVAAIRGTFLFQRRLLAARWHALVQQVRESARWN